MPFQDAEDIASSALRNALEHHDSSRGKLHPFCWTTVCNAVKNYWRDKKVDLPFEDEQWSHPDGGPDIILEGKARIESMKRTVERLLCLLSGDECAFMTLLGEVVDELGDRAVSETARRLGLEPAKGWDLFHRIQRQAQSLEAPAAAPVLRKIKRSAPSKERLDSEAAIDFAAAKLSVDRVSESHAPRLEAMFKVDAVQEPDPLFGIAGAMAREEAFERFWKTV